MELREEMKTVKAIDSYWAGKKEPLRCYLGISGLGVPCERRVWFNFRWFDEEELEPRVKRLLDRGRREETQVVRNLKAIGCKVVSTGAKQQMVSLNGWVKGHVDGIIESGLPESRNNRHILEIKTSNDKAFKELQKDGVQKAKPQHYAQMQLYMLGTGISRAMYIVVNKNDDAIYTERVKLDSDFAQMMASKGLEIAVSHDAPPGISDSPTWYQCKMCPFWAVCFAHKEPKRTCRSCEHCGFDVNGYSWCHKNGCTRLSNKKQQEACEGYEVIKWN